MFKELKIDNAKSVRHGIILLLVSASILSICVSFTSAQSFVCTTVTVINPLNGGSSTVSSCSQSGLSVWSSSCTATVTVGGVVVEMSGTVPVTTVTYPGPPASAYSGQNVCLTGFIAPATGPMSATSASSASSSGFPSSFNPTDPVTLIILILVASVAYLVGKRRK